MWAIWDNSRKDWFRGHERTYSYIMVFDSKEQANVAFAKIYFLAVDNKDMQLKEFISNKE